MTERSGAQQGEGDHSDAVSASIGVSPGREHNGVGEVIAESRSDCSLPFVGFLRYQWSESCATDRRFSRRVRHGANVAAPP